MVSPLNLSNEMNWVDDLSIKLTPLTADSRTNNIKILVIISMCALFENRIFIHSTNNNEVVKCYKITQHQNQLSLKSVVYSRSKILIEARITTRI